MLDGLAFMCIANPPTSIVAYIEALVLMLAMKTLQNSSKLTSPEPVKSTTIKTSWISWSV
jgi:hypothetical protein